MILVSLRQISLAFGQAPLLDATDLQVAKGDRIGLLGRNGAGKSSLLGLIQGRIAPDAGQIDRRQGLRITELPQDVPVGDRRTVLETVAGGAGPTGQDLLRFFELSRHADTGTEQELADLQQRIDAGHGWDKLQLIEQIIDRLDLEAPQRMDQLSGGQRRRALLARA
ncbi:MAG: ABC transporter ATP-binding protein, partial [Deltaproteobacteria bacterium]